MASKSPRRKELLLAAGIEPVVIPSGADEDVPEGLESKPEELVMHLARTKAAAVASAYPDDLVLGADTVVVLDGRILGKPGSRDEAIRMLKDLRGRTHHVYTGIAMRLPGRNNFISDFDCTDVTMEKIDDNEIEWYVDTGEPMDKAGAYALQGMGAMFVSRVNGDYTSVIGLALPKLYKMLKGSGVDIRELVHP